jgi:bifunctional non-homologous end joining protein LigD
MSEDLEASGIDFFEAARKMELKGIIAKKGDSSYLAGTRTKDWLKVKTLKSQKALIAGYTSKPGTGRKPETFILALLENGTLTYIGETSPGLSGELKTDMHTRLRALVTNKPPFSATPAQYLAKGKTEITWVKPEIVCEVTYREVVNNLLRDAGFHGVRDDKQAEDITWEKPLAVSAMLGREPSRKIKKTAPAVKTNTSKKKPVKEKSQRFLDPKEEMQTRLVNGHELKFTNLGKLYWPKEQITKRDMLNYYYEVMPYMLPYMKDRPQSLNRHPGGIHGESFYQKNVSGKVEPWITTHDYQNTSKEGNKTFLVCTDEASLLYIAKLGCIEMNPWHSRLSAPDNPDWCVVDLDPDTNSFEQVIEVANVVKKILDAIDVPCYPKTSGSTGMHLYIPLGAKYNYDQSKQLAELIVTLAHQELPGFTSVERNPAKRKGKIYLDFLQNRPIQTIAAPYSLRPKPGATASAPLLWHEVKNGLSLTQFNISTMLPRIKETGDLFTGVLGEGIDLGKVLEKASSVFG